jgi:hypothetical protein
MLATELSVEDVEKMKKNSNVLSILKDVKVELFLPPSSSSYLGDKKSREEKKGKRKLAGIGYEKVHDDDDNYNSTSTFAPWGIKDINAPSISWNKTNTLIKNIEIDADVYILDTGVDEKHPDLNVVESISVLPHKLSHTPFHGHGTHVAGIIGARQTAQGGGVAPGVRIHSVRMLDQYGSGRLSWILSALNFITQRCRQHNKDDKTNGTPVLVNFSVGYSVTEENKKEMDYLDQVVNRTVDAGAIIICAAGNSGEDAKFTNPARNPRVITVAAYNSNRQFSSFSNFGSSIDICAPGEEILSTWLNGKYKFMDGTSASTPHVTGALVLLLLASKREFGKEEEEKKRIRKKDEIMNLLLSGSTSTTSSSSSIDLADVPPGTTSSTIQLVDKIPFIGKCEMSAKITLATKKEKEKEKEKDDGKDDGKDEKLQKESRQFFSVKFS